MMRTTLNKSRYARALACIGLFCSAVIISCAWVPRTLAQNVTTSRPPPRTTGLENYANNQTVIAIPFSKENIQQLKKRRLLYRYRLIYISANDLRSAQTGFIYIGFFASQDDALALKNDSLFIFPEQTIKHISESEHQAIIAAMNATDDQVSQAYFVIAMDANDTSVFDKTAKQLLASARLAYNNGKYSDAITQYYLLATLADDQELAAWAMELIGLCQEKQKHFAEAIDTYQAIIDNYPNSAGISRVTQRHLGLTTAANDELDARPKTRSSQGHVKVFTRGVFGQSYRSAIHTINEEDTEQTYTALTSNVDVRTSARWRDHTLKARINGYRVNDQFDSENSETRLKRLFIDYHHLPTGAHATAGRIKDYDNGVFMPYDGVSASYPVYKNVRIAVSAGQPVYFDAIQKNLNHQFFSVNSAWEANKNWRINGYIVSQTLNGETDRAALGLRTQYFTPVVTSSLNIDYDFAFGELNNLLWNGSYRLNKKNQFSAIYGQQRAPLLSASNIFIGQPELDLDLYLRTEANKDNLLNDALARTSLNEYYTLTFHREMTADTQLNIDMSHSYLSQIPQLETLTTPNIDNATTQSFLYNAYGAQLVMQKFLTQTDAITLGVRSSSSDTSESLTMYLHERLRYGSHFYIQPKLGFIDTNIHPTGANKKTVRYAMALICRPWRSTELNVELGGEYIETGIERGSFSSNFIFAGYRVNF